MSWRSSPRTVPAALASWPTSPHTATARQWLDEVVGYLDDSRRLLADLLGRHLPQVRYRPPDGTYLAWLDCTALDLPGSPGEIVTERARVTVVDGPAFGEGGAGSFRFNFATPQPILAEMVQRIAAVLDDPAGG